MKAIEKLCCAVLLLCAGLLLLPQAGEARTPLRLARLPLIVESPYAPQEVGELIEDRLDRALHVPLNGTLHVVEELPTAEVEQALEEARAELRAQGKRPRYRDAMPLVAAKLDADLVVCPVLTDYHEYIFYGSGPFFDDDTISMDSYVALEIDGYDRAEQKNISKRTSRYYRDSYSTQGTAEALAREAVEALVRETKLNERVTRPLREMQAPAAAVPAAD
ncbi:hypothetical protein [Selenomonas bovis]|uniref:hypothetical protein n=1 Tax=Selenomonas bovis TaxID=416586 RepID=UPI000371C8CF|nr:hypothetical protein [Selenomonas bovis]